MDDTSPLSIDRLLDAAPRHPRRIVCLTEETTDTLYRLGAGDRVVGVSGYTVFPPEARAKPRISAFTSARIDKILELNPDLVLGFSDLQAGIASELIERGVPVCVFNQRSIAGILQMIGALGGIVDRSEEAAALVEELAKHLREVASRAATRATRPRVFLEEWNDPLISGIRWWSELVEIAGGTDICRDVRDAQAASGRVVRPEDIAGRDPELVIASWCGKKASERLIVERPGWQDVTAVRNDQLYELKSAYILQPGPVALTDGLRQLEAIVSAVATRQTLPRRRVGELRSAE